MKRISVLCLLLGWSLAAWAGAQDVPALRLAGEPYLSLTDVSRALGYSVSEAPNSLTVRAEGGMLTVFESPDILWKTPTSAEDELNLPAPVVRQNGLWYAPEELFVLFEVRLEGEALVLPDGRRLDLTFPLEKVAARGRGFETVSLGNQVDALALYASGSAGADSVSLLLVDVGLLGLAFPDQQRALDAFMGSLKRGRPLYFVVSASSESPWETVVRFHQGEQSFEARYPEGLNVLEGEAGSASPERPVSGVVILPDTFNLREPVSVEWMSAGSSFQFRR